MNPELDKAEAEIESARQCIAAGGEENADVAVEHLDIAVRCLQVARGELAFGTKPFTVDPTSDSFAWLVPGQRTGDHDAGDQAAPELPRTPPEPDGTVAMVRQLAARGREIVAGIAGDVHWQCS